MSTISLFLDVLGPVVILVAVGAIAGPRLSISASSLSTLAFWVLGPAFVFNLFSTSGLELGTVAKLAAAGVAGMAAAIAVAAVGNRAIGSSPSVAAASTITSAYGNVGNAGLAITVVALAAGPLWILVEDLGPA